MPPPNTATPATLVEFPYIEMSFGETTARNISATIAPEGMPVLDLGQYVSLTSFTVEDGDGD